MAFTVREEDGDHDQFARCADGVRGCLRRLAAWPVVSVTMEPRSAEPTQSLTEGSRTSRDAVRGHIMRLAVFAIVAVAGLVGMYSVALAVRKLDARATRNASLSAVDRTFGELWEPHVIRDPGVLQDAVRIMPSNATFRVVIGPRWRPAIRTRWTPSLERDFLVFHMLPRRLTESSSSPWVFCLGCDIESLGGKAVVISRGPDGFAFVRVWRHG